MGFGRRSFITDFVNTFAPYTSWVEVPKSIGATDLYPAIDAIADRRTDNPEGMDEDVAAAPPVDDGVGAVNVVLIENRFPIGELRFEARLNKRRKKIQTESVTVGTVLSKGYSASWERHQNIR